jgi:hypothetical protein
MKISSSSSKFLAQWKHVEVARYVDSLGRVIREKKDDLPVFYSVEDIDIYRESNSNTGLYTSIWRYDKPDIESAVRLGSLYFDIDSDDIEESYKECILLYDFLKSKIPASAVLVYFTGKKGFHIECEAVTLGINPSNNLPNIFRWIATKVKDQLNLNNLDFSVYDARRMWRLEGSRHQDTGLYKNLIPDNILYDSIGVVKEYCKNRQANDVADQQFNAGANEWFREYIYDLEIEKERSKDFLAYFNKHGSSAFKEYKEVDKEFTPKRLIEGCPSIRDLWQQAIDNHFLEHEARLFLCSILSYTEDSVKFLHGILSNCDDYNYDKSSSHINDWIRRRQLGIGGRPYTCERANSVGVGCGNCSLDQRKKWIKVGDRYVESDELSSPSPIRFAYVSVKKGGKPDA